MAKKKTWIWDGKPVSKTSFYRHQAEAKATGKLTVKARNPMTKLVEARAEPPQNVYTHASPEVAPIEQVRPTLAPPDPVDDALIRDHMVAMRAGGILLEGRVDPNLPVTITPRFFLAIMRLLDRMGY